MSVVPGRKNARRTVSGEPAGHASTSQILVPDSGVEANTGTMPDGPPTKDVDRMSAMNSKVDSAMNHRHGWAILRDPNFSEEAFNAFISGGAYIRAAQGGLARATNQYLKDIQVREKI